MTRRRGTAIVIAVLSAWIPCSAAPTGPDRLTFRVPSLTGGTISSEDFKGRVVVVDVWATWCGPCRMVIPHMVDLQKRWSGHGVSVLGLNSESSDGDFDALAVREFVVKAGINYPIGVLDLSTYRKIERLAGDERGGLSIPTTIVLGKGGEIVRVFPGYYPGQEKDVERLVKSLTAAGPPKAAP
ncbi:MAG: TlpA family protein disulfide reductase [Candidatus Polarisedimenticolia bacterium]